MPNIITPSYFNTGEIKIPNAVSGNAGEGLNGDLQAIIDKYEKGLLMAALGVSQYTELQVELDKLPFVADTDPPSLETAAQKWIDLVNGSGAYQGIKRIIGNYIYCNWLRFDEVTLTTTGAGKAKAQNHTVADYNQKYVDRWNEFVYWWQQGNEEDTSLLEFLNDTDGLSADKFHYFKFENQFGL